MSTISFAADVEMPTSDLNEGSIGQTYIGQDGTKYVFYDDQLVLTRKKTAYNGAIFDHDSWWDGGPLGNQAKATTEAYKDGDYNTPHKNYTRVRVVLSLIPASIVEDSERQWGDRYSHAESSRKNDYFEWDYAMRSYWGDETT